MPRRPFPPEHAKRRHALGGDKGRQVDDAEDAAPLAAPGPRLPAQARNGRAGRKARKGMGDEDDVLVLVEMWDDDGAHVLRVVVHDGLRVADSAQAVAFGGEAGGAETEEEGVETGGGVEGA